MIILNKSNWIIIPKTSPAYEKVKDLLTIPEHRKSRVNIWDDTVGRFRTTTTSISAITYLYTIKNECLFVYYGLYKYIKYLIDDEPQAYAGVTEHPLLNVSMIIDNLYEEIKKVSEDDLSGFYTNILPGISLYDYQLKALSAIFENKRGMLHIPTGGGKTEIICATLQIMKNVYGKYPTTLLFEPTIELMKGIKKRFKSYKIPINDYRETRMIFSNKINIAHPTSVMNDLEHNNKLLEKIEVQFFDEVHHVSSTTWGTPTYNMPNLIYSIGVSATSISHYHLNGTHIDDFTSEELKRLGHCGPIIFKMTGETLIKNKNLAYPKLVILDNPANEEMNDDVVDYIWDNVRKIRLQSKARTELIAKAAIVMAKYDRKTVIMMNNLSWGREIMHKIWELGYGDDVRTCFGGSTYQKCNKNTGKIEKEYNNVLDLLAQNKIKIVIGSSSIQEGVDVPHLDCCALAFGGKSDRTSLQSIGRAMRTTKTGKYAYIIDISDHEDVMLSRQADERRIKYQKVLNIVKDEDILDRCSIKEFEDKFKEWENL